MSTRGVIWSGLTRFCHVYALFETNSGTPYAVQYRATDPLWVLCSEQLFKRRDNDDVGSETAIKCAKHP